MALALPTVSQEVSLTRYLTEIKRFPILSDKEENDLAVRWFDKADLKAAQQLVTSHLRLVAKIAFQFKGYGLSMADIISEGNIGLMTAVKKFDPYKGFKLATYATWWIKATIQDYILKSWSIVKIGSSAAHKKLFFNLKKIKSKLLHLHEGQVPINEIELIAKELDVRKEDVAEMNNRLNPYGDSLNVTMYDNEQEELMDTIVEERDNQEVMLLEAQEEDYKRRKFKKAFALLAERERNIIQERKLKEKPTTLEVLSQKYKVSTERIRQIEENAMKKLKEKVMVL